MGHLPFGTVEAIGGNEWSFFFLCLGFHPLAEAVYALLLKFYLPVASSSMIEQEAPKNFSDLALLTEAEHALSQCSRLLPAAVDSYPIQPHLFGGTQLLDGLDKDRLILYIQSI